MPNWCFNEIVFYCTDGNKNELIRLHDALKRQLETKSIIENDFGNGWLGNTAHHHGIDYKNDNCRGQIYEVNDINDEDSFFPILTSTAWTPKLGLWDEVCKSYEGVAFHYCSEEGGNGIYVNTDREGIFLDKRFVIISCCNNHNGPLPKEYFLEGVDADDVYSGDLYYSSFDKMAEAIEKMTGKKFESADEIEKYLENALQAYCGDGSVSVYEYEYE